MPRYRPRAYGQGDLDRLCGLYAVVNAIRHTIGPIHRFRGGECLWLFQQLALVMARRRVLGTMVAVGLNTRHVQLLLRTSQALLADRFGFSIDYQCPYHRRSDVRLHELTRVIRSATTEPGMAALARFCDHWSVIERDTGKAFRLLDSASFKQIRHRKVVLGPGLGATDGDKEWAIPATLHILTYRPAH